MGAAWTPKVVEMMAFLALVRGFGPLFLHTFAVQVQSVSNEPGFLD